MNLNQQSPLSSQGPSMRCPYCESEVRNEVEGGGEVVCSECSGKFQATVPEQKVASRPVQPVNREQQIVLNSKIKVCMLVSGIFNVLVGLAWIGTLIGAPIGIAQIVLACCEFTYYSTASKKPLQDALKQGMILGTIEIFLGILNPIAFVCGILVVIFINTHEK